MRLVHLSASLYADVGFSNRPFEVKHFQTIRHCSVDVAHGLALLFGIGTRPLYGVFFVKEFAKLSFVGFLVRS
jgi:hypothetical protein